MPKSLPNMRYIRMDMTHSSSAGVVAMLEAQALAELPENQPSTNMNAAGTIAWCKTNVPVTPAQPAATRVDTDNVAALAEINADPNWYPST